MPNIINVLTDSFQLLRERPRFFVPKLVSSILGAFWFIGLMSRTGPLYFYAATGPLLAVVALFVSVMLAAMVDSKEQDNILGRGFLAASGKWRKILLSFLAFTLAAALIYVPLAAGFAYYYFTGELLAFAAGVFFSLFLLVGFGFVSYFFPVSLLEKGSVIEGFRDSASMAADNSKEVVPLTLLSFAMLLLAAFTPDAGMKMLGYAGFFVMRIVSGVVTTYIFVVSPEYYWRASP